MWGQQLRAIHAPYLFHPKIIFEKYFSGEKNHIQIFIYPPSNIYLLSFTKLPKKLLRQHLVKVWVNIKSWIRLRQFSSFQRNAFETPKSLSFFVNIKSKYSKREEEENFTMENADKKLSFFIKKIEDFFYFFKNRFLSLVYLER